MRGGFVRKFSLIVRSGNYYGLVYVNIKRAKYSLRWLTACPYNNDKSHAIDR